MHNENHPREVECLIDIKELARRLSLSHYTLYNWVWQGRLMPIRLGPRCLRFDYDEVLLSLRQATRHRNTPEGGA